MHKNLIKFIAIAGISASLITPVFAAQLDFTTVPDGVKLGVVSIPSLGSTTSSRMLGLNTSGVLTDFDMPSGGSSGLSGSGTSSQVCLFTGSTAVGGDTGLTVSGTGSSLEVTASKISSGNYKFTGTGLQNCNAANGKFIGTDASGNQTCENLPSGVGAPHYDTTSASYTAAENVTAHQAVYISQGSSGSNTMIMANSCDTGDPIQFGQTGGILSLRQPVAASTFSGTANTIHARLKKVGSPTGNVVLTARLQSDNSVLATATVAASSLTTSIASTTATFNTTFSNSSAIYVQASADGGTDANNYFIFDASATNSPNCLGGGDRQYTADGTNWPGSGDHEDLIFTLTSETPSSTAGQVLRAFDNGTASQRLVVGFPVSDTTSGNSVALVISGEVTGFSGLTTGEPYYLSNNTSGDNLSTTPGTNSVLVGVASNATTLILK